jgi:PAS domain S-box-containing protein
MTIAPGYSGNHDGTDPVSPTRDDIDRPRSDGARQEKQGKTDQLLERIKELGCLYAFSELLQHPALSPPAICQGVVDLIPAGWQYPENACARLVLEEQHFTTENFRETAWKLDSPIAVRGRPVGALEVYYLSEKPICDEGPFLAEERRLLNALTGRFGKTIERWEAEAALRRSELLFHTLAQVSPVGIFRTDARGACVYVNERWCEIAGISADAALGQGWARAIHPEDRERVSAEWYRSAEEKRPFKMEYRFERPDGLSTWVVGQAMREPGGPDGVGGYVGTITDITDRKHTEEALRSSEESLTRAQRVARIGSWHLDVTSHTLGCSDEAYRIFGLPIGTPLTYERVLELVHPDDRRAFDDAWQAALASGRSSLEYRAIVAGETRWISGIAEIERDGGGTPLRGVGTIQDITQHRALDDALRVHIQQLDALQTVSAEIIRELHLPPLLDLIVRKSMELVGGAGGTIYLWDESGQRLVPHVWVGHSGAWGRDGQVRIGEGLVGLVAERREGLIVNDYRSWPHARAFILQQTNVTAAIAEPLLCRGRLLGVVAIDDQGGGRRFTEQDRMPLRLFAAQAAVTVENAQLYAQVRRHAEELERKVEERTRDLQAAYADMEAFSYSVSHDLHAPLISIDGFSRLLLTKYQTVLDVQGQEYLQRVRVATRHMVERIDAMLSLARVSHQPIAPEPVNLSTLARAVARELRQREPDRTAEIHIQEDLVVQGDAQLLRALLENLLGNAWKFTVRRRPARIDVGRLSGATGEVVYFVRDNGVGFDMVHADRLFGAFERYHAADDFPGTGIGLATVERIVRRHRGRVWAEGVVDGGASFFFTLGMPTSDLEPNP